MFCVTELEVRERPEAASHWAAVPADDQTNADDEEQEVEFAEWFDEAGALSLRADGRRRRDEDEDEDEEEEFDFEDEEEAEEDEEFWDDEFEDEEEEEDEDFDEYLDDEEDED